MEVPAVSKGPAFVFFKDWDRSHKASAGGHNKFGFLTGDGVLIYPFRRRTRIIQYERFPKTPHRWVPVNLEAHEKNVTTFFTGNVQSADLFHLGVKAVASREWSFFDDPVKLPLLKPISSEEFESRWLQLIDTVAVGDLIFTFDSSSWISRLIAYGDCGTWSHVASYVGQGQICEAISAGVVERSMEVYHDPKYRLGLYRGPTDAEQISKMVAFTKSQIGKRYNYRGALRLGFRKLLNVQPRTLRPRDMSPNDLAMRLRLVFVV